MPHKNTTRYFASGEYYHVYNRGVNKQLIFTSPDHYSYFFQTLKFYLYAPPNIPTISLGNRRTPMETNEVQLISDCLMPNHFHLLLKQNSDQGISKLLKRICDVYVNYFNKDQKRLGPLFESKFKAIIIPNDIYLLHLTRYIHTNPKPIWAQSLKDYPYSSYHEYVNPDQNNLTQPSIVLDQFSSDRHKAIKMYRQFVEQTETDFDLPNKYFLDID